MSRRIANGRFASLMSKLAQSIGSNCQVADIAYQCKCTRRALALYTTGRKHLPLLETKLAAVFNLSVPALRRALGLPAVTSVRSKPTTRGEK